MLKNKSTHSSQIEIFIQKDMGIIQSTIFQSNDQKHSQNSNRISTGLSQSQIWYSSIDDLDNLSEDNYLIRTLNRVEHEKVHRFMFSDDRKRALLSILLQRALVSSQFNLTKCDYELRRTREV